MPWPVWTTLEKEQTGKDQRSGIRDWRIGGMKTDTADYSVHGSLLIPGWKQRNSAHCFSHCPTTFLVHSWFIVRGSYVSSDMVRIDHNLMIDGIVAGWQFGKHWLVKELWERGIKRVLSQEPNTWNPVQFLPEARNTSQRLFESVNSRVVDSYRYLWQPL